MDYKAVLEEQIRELQKKQDKAIEQNSPQECCTISTTIKKLIAYLKSNF